MKIESLVEKHAGASVAYAAEDTALDDIKALSEDFGLSYDVAEFIYLEEMEEGSLNEAKALGNIAAMTILSPPIWAIYRALGGLLSKAKRKCGTFEISRKRDVCIQEAHIDILEKKKKLVAKAAEDCAERAGDNEKKVAKCKESMRKSNEKYDARIAKHAAKAAKLKKKRGLDD